MKLPFFGLLVVADYAYYGTEIYMPLDTVALFVCTVLFFVSMAVVTLSETIVSPMLMSEYAFSSKKTVTIGAIILTGSGVIATSSILSSANLAKRFTDRNVILAGLVILVVSYIMFLPFGPGYPKLTMSTLHHPNGTLVESDVDYIGGCHYEYSWCVSTPKVAFVQYIIGTALSFIGFPMVYVVTTALYAKIIGPFPQGKYMGWLSAVGGLARIGGPVYVTYLFKNFGPRWTAIGVNGIVVCSIILLSITWKRIIPYRERHPKMSTTDIVENTNVEG